MLHASVELVEGVLVRVFEATCTLLHNDGGRWDQLLDGQLFDQLLFQVFGVFDVSIEQLLELLEIHMLVTNFFHSLLFAVCLDDLMSAGENLGWG